MSAQTEIYVLDTETTGLKGAPIDVVVDVGICKVNLTEGTVEDAYSSVVGHDISKWNDYRKNAWIFENTDMTLDMVKDAPAFDTVKSEVDKIILGKYLTTYNIEYDLDGFLYKDPWSYKGKIKECNDIMKVAMNICKLPSNFYGCKYRYPKLDYAYSAIVKGDPANIHGVQDHRALSDARMASYLMIQMYKDGSYLP